MKKTQQHAFPAMIGGSSLLVIFAVLCLTIFALLCLNTALADERLTNASAEAVKAYYEADAQAEEIFACIRNGEIPDEVEESNGVYQYSCKISDTQELQVELQYEEHTWTVLRWQAVSVHQEV